MQRQLAFRAEVGCKTGPLKKTRGKRMQYSTLTARTCCSLRGSSLLKNVSKSSEKKDKKTFIMCNMATIRRT
jgi:hypothetical protein